MAEIMQYAPSTWIGEQLRNARVLNDQEVPQLDGPLQKSAPVHKNVSL